MSMDKKEGKRHLRPRAKEVREGPAGRVGGSFWKEEQLGLSFKDGGAEQGSPTPDVSSHAGYIQTRKPSLAWGIAAYGRRRK